MPYKYVMSNCCEGVTALLLSYLDHQGIRGGSDSSSSNCSNSSNCSSSRTIRAASGPIPFIAGARHTWLEVLDGDGEEVVPLDTSFVFEKLQGAGQDCFEVSRPTLKRVRKRPIL